MLLTVHALPCQSSADDYLHKHFVYRAVQLVTILIS